MKDLTSVCADAFVTSITNAFVPGWIDFETVEANGLSLLAMTAEFLGAIVEDGILAPESCLVIISAAFSATFWAIFSATGF